MAVIVKCDPFQVSLGQVATLTVPRYASAQPRAGDDVFLWFSETGGGQGLAYLGEVSSVRSEGKAVEMSVIARAIVRRRFQLSNLREHRDSLDSSEMSSLSKKLYRHSLNKVAELSPGEAMILRAAFD